MILPCDFVSEILCPRFRLFSRVRGNVVACGRGARCVGLSVCKCVDECKCLRVREHVRECERAGLIVQCSTLSAHCTWVFVQARVHLLGFVRESRSPLLSRSRLLARSRVRHARVRACSRVHYARALSRP